MLSSVMSISLALRILLALAGLGVLAPVCASTQEATRQTAQQAEVVMEVAGPPASGFFAWRDPIVPPKREAAWTCIKRIRRTHQEYTQMQVIFAGGLHPRAIPQFLNFNRVSYVRIF